MLLRTTFTSVLFFIGMHASAAPLCSAKLDLLFVIDNSGSVMPIQQKLVDSAKTLFDDLSKRGYDFRVAVTTSEAYLAGPIFANNLEMSLFRDGSRHTHSGVRVIDNNTPDRENVFITNVTQGINGSGDERAFSSMQASLLNPQNPEFLRSDSYLSVVILSDEDDFSSAARPEYSWTYAQGIDDHDYASAALDSVDSYRQFLDQLTNSTPYARRYSVSAITVLDNSCMASPSAIIGKRYIELATKTNGVLASICDTTFAPALRRIVENIARSN
jgi:hypothetical protein